MPDLPGIVPDDDQPWYCEMNRDPARNTCEAPQQPDDAVLDEAVLALLTEVSLGLGLGLGLGLRLGLRLG